MKIRAGGRARGSVGSSPGERMVLAGAEPVREPSMRMPSSRWDTMPSTRHDGVPTLSREITTYGRHHRVAVPPALVRATEMPHAGINADAAFRPIRGAYIPQTRAGDPVRSGE